MGSRPVVLVSAHAVDRAQQRSCEAMLLGAVRREIEDAICEGRVSKRRPSWLVDPPFYLATPHQWERFAWPASRDRVWVLRKRRDFVPSRMRFATQFVALTCLVSDERVAA